MTLSTDRIELRLGMEMLEEIDAAVDRGHLDNRQAYIRIAIREKLEKELVKV